MEKFSGKPVASDTSLTEVLHDLSILLKLS